MIIAFIIATAIAIFFAILWSEEKERRVQAEMKIKQLAHDLGMRSKELCDLLEVIYAAALANGYTVEELHKAREDKAKERGGFSKKLRLLEVT